MRKILAGSRFAGLGGAAVRALAAGGGDPVVIAASEEDPDPEPGADPEPAPEPAPEVDPAPDPQPEPVAESSAAESERARVATVFASEHSQGRERQAADMLQTSMSADEIVGLLAKSPKGASSMLASLASDKNPDLGAGASAESTGRTAAASVWDRAAQANGRNPQKKEG